MKRKIVIVLLLFLIVAMVIGLHVVEIVKGKMSHVKISTVDNITYVDVCYDDIASWFGIPVSLNLVYDTVLYSIVGLIFVCVALVLKGEKGDIIE